LIDADRLAEAIGGGFVGLVVTHLTSQVAGVAADLAGSGVCARTLRMAQPVANGDLELERVAVEPAQPLA
jgi:hypothetical protein